MKNKGEEHFEQAVAAFRAWAAALPDAERSGYWECGYPSWPNVWVTFEARLWASNPDQWDQDARALAFCALAGDNESEGLKNALARWPPHLLALVKAGLHSAEPDARWQHADALGSMDAPDGEVAPILEAYAVDPDEYVSRRALLALGRRRTPVAEALAQRAWDTGHEYQRIAALHVFAALRSPVLPPLPPTRSRGRAPSCGGSGREGPRCDACPLWIMSRMRQPRPPQPDPSGRIARAAGSAAFAAAPPGARGA